MQDMNFRISSFPIISNTKSYLGMKIKFNHQKHIFLMIFRDSYLCFFLNNIPSELFVLAHLTNCDDSFVLVIPFLAKKKKKKSAINAKK